MKSIIYCALLICICISCSENDFLLDNEEIQIETESKHGLKYNPHDPNAPHYPIGDQFDQIYWEDILSTTVTTIKSTQLGNESFESKTQVNEKYGFFSSKFKIVVDGKVVGKVHFGGQLKNADKIIKKAYKKLKKKSKEIEEMPEDEAIKFIKDVLGLPDLGDDNDDDEETTNTTDITQLKNNNSNSSFSYISDGFVFENKFNIEHWGKYSILSSNKEEDSGFYVSMVKKSSDKVSVSLSFDFPEEDYNEHYEKLINLTIKAEEPSLFVKDFKSELQKYVDARLVGVLDEAALEEFIRKVLFPIPGEEGTIDDLLDENK